ncbi:MAG: TRAP transporter substrate-binding protein DctP [Deltaproteobacteria bacterium]|jgi:TRAP-type mannitol/chloroaromatic compound transport system substrate-binding protein|nr:TRAP transporter substrate-binding protein DctP [Deltaproteobacteria bacterium]
MKSICIFVIVVIVTAGFMFGPHALAAEKVNWRMGSTWTPAINMYHGDKSMVKYVKQMTDGNFRIQWFPAGSLMSEFEYFDACSKGVVEAVGDWPSYWVDKDVAFDFLGSMPYGFTNMDYVIWYYQFGGDELYNEAYGKFGMKYFNLGATTAESGFRTSAKTGPIANLADYKGKKLRTPARATIWILQQIGAEPVNMPFGEFFPALESGTLDGAEFSSPGIDWEMGFAEITKYWSGPGWFQPASQVGVAVNAKAFSKLSKQYQAILRIACKAAAMESLTYYEAGSGRSIEKFREEGTEIVKLDKESLEKLDELSGQYIVMAVRERGGLFARILKSQMDYLKEYKDWRDMTGKFGFGFHPTYVDKVLDELDKRGIK